MIRTDGVRIELTPFRDEVKLEVTFVGSAAEIQRLRIAITQATLYRDFSDDDRPRERAAPLKISEGDPRALAPHSEILRLGDGK